MSDKTRLQNNNRDLKIIEGTLEQVSDVIQTLPDASTCTATSNDIMTGKTAVSREGLVEGGLTTTSESLYIDYLPYTLYAPTGSLLESVQLNLGQVDGLQPDNIRAGVSIFGVEGTLESGGIGKPYNIYMFESTTQRDNDESGNIYCGGDLSVIRRNVTTFSFDQSVSFYCLMYLPKRLQMDAFIQYPQGMESYMIGGCWTFMNASWHSDPGTVSEVFWGSDKHYHVDLVLNFEVMNHSGGYVSLRVSYQTANTYETSSWPLDATDTMERVTGELYWVLSTDEDNPVLITSVNDDDYLGLPCSMSAQSSQQFMSNCWLYTCGIGGYECEYSDLAVWDVTNRRWNTVANYSY